MKTSVVARVRVENMGKCSIEERPCVSNCHHVCVSLYILNLIDLHIKSYLIQSFSPDVTRLLRSKECLACEGKMRKKQSSLTVRQKQD